MPSNLDDLERLARLRDSGVLSPQEFDAQKAALLGAPPTTAAPAPFYQQPIPHHYPGVGAPRRSAASPALFAIIATVIIATLVAGYFLLRPKATPSVGHADDMSGKVASFPSEVRGAWAGTGDCAGARITFGETSFETDRAFAELPMGTTPVHDITWTGSNLAATFDKSGHRDFLFAEFNEQHKFEIDYSRARACVLRRPE